jgi:mRNA interferase MazF
LKILYKAKRGDIIWLDFDPQSGHEQQGRRPALVVSNNTFNKLQTKTAMVCPITHTDRGLKIHIKLDNRTNTNGFIMCDQAKILDVFNRNAEFIEKAPDTIVEEAVDIIIGFVE